jgi:hypothetical protein
MVPVAQLMVAAVHIMGAQHAAALAPKVAATLGTWLSGQVPTHPEHVGAQHVACRTAGAPAAVVAAAAIGPVLAAQVTVEHIMRVQHSATLAPGVVPALGV